MVNNTTEEFTKIARQGNTPIVLGVMGIPFLVQGHKHASSPGTMIRGVRVNYITQLLQNR